MPFDAEYHEAYRLEGKKTEYGRQQKCGESEGCVSKNCENEKRKYEPVTNEGCVLVIGRVQ